MKSILGGGRRTLYLAVNPETGHRAALRALGDDDTGASFTEFANEVTSMLELSHRPEVVTRALDDGREVLLALIDPDAPGTGSTRFAATTRLERAPKPRRSLGLAVFLFGLAFLLVMLGLWRRAPQAATSPPVEVPAPVVVVAPSPPPEPAPPPQEVAKVVEPPPVKPAPAKPASASKLAAPRAVATPCEPTDEWKKHRRADLQELDDRVQRSDTLWRQEQPHLDRVSGLILRARDEGDCREVEGELRKLVSRIIGPE